MAERRMFAKTIIDSDAFLDMPASTQVLYFHLSMRADDDGFVNNPRTVMRICGGKDDDMKLLIAKKFVIAFECNVVVIKHWRIHNYIQKDRKQATKYIELLKELRLDENNAYTQSEGRMIAGVTEDVSKVDTQVRLGKDSIGKDSKGKSKKNKADKSAAVPRQLTDYFCEKYLEKYETKYQFEAKDGVLLNSLLKAYDIDFMRDFIDWFFSTDDKFIEQAGRNVGILKTSRDKYIAYRSQQEKDKAELEKAAEIRRKAEKLI
jgi:hypothetical protein